MYELVKIVHIYTEIAMTLASFAAYASALLLAVTLPSPAMLAVLTTGLTRQNGEDPSSTPPSLLPKHARAARFRPDAEALATGLGVAAGDVLVAGLALSSLMYLAAYFGWLFTVCKYAGAAYLIYLGIGLWRSGAAGPYRTDTPQGSCPRAFGLGLAVALGNPKAILFHGSLLPVVFNLDTIGLSDLVVILSLVFAVNAVVIAGCTVLSGKASGWFQASRRTRWMHRASAIVIGGTGVFVAAR